MQEPTPGSAAGEIRQRAQKLYVHAMEAAKKQQYDYAIRLLREACKLCPDVLIFRRALRATERQKYGGTRRGSKFAAITTLRARARLKAALARSNLLAALEACEDILEANPWDVTALVTEADILDQLGYTESAVWVAETAVGANQNDPQANRKLAELYEKVGEYSRAISLWERVKQLCPEDKEAASRVKNLAAAETIQRGGYDHAEHVQDVLVQQPEEASEGEVPAAGTKGEDRLAELRRRIEADPTDVEACLELSRRLRELRRWDEAARLVERSLHATGGHPDLQTELADIEIDRLRYDLAVAQSQLASDPDNPARREKVAELERRLNDYELREYRRRSERFPTDRRLKCEYAKRLARAGLYDEAISILQQIRQDPRVRLEALMWLGHCFFAKKLHRLAERSYREALDLLRDSGGRDEEALKEVHYLLGRTYEEMGNREEAQKHFEEVAALDYGYRDVARRLESLSQST